MWLKIVYDEDDIAYWPEKPEKISISLELSSVIIIPQTAKTFRVSPIFPLNIINNKTKLDNTKIRFFNLPNAYCALGRIEKKGGKELKDSVFFSLGLSSVILICNSDNLLAEFREVIGQKENAFEEWNVLDGKIAKIDYDVLNRKSLVDESDLKTDYSVLDTTERAIVDEFRINIKLLSLKLHFHMPSEKSKIHKLVEEIESLVKELIYLHTNNGDVPVTLSEYSAEELKDKKLINVIRHQNVDRIIQINSALSYVATQAFSGAIPILERRSLIRRNSLLGIGSAILALNRIARFIENAFSLINFDKIIREFMNVASPLKGHENFPLYSSNEWSLGSVNKYTNKAVGVATFSKLPYFSGRLGFRETEYSIAAALQSVTSGASLEWSLMTLTHEMLHGHTRDIITSIFYGEDSVKPEEQQNTFYEALRNKLHKRQTNETQIDSVRNIILGYCAMTNTHGSITVKTAYNVDLKMILPNEQNLWRTFESENRNISEIFVHVLDLHYFYASRISVYIPLIWCSWLSVPHISGDIRQYILRSLLTISSNIKANPHLRFKMSITGFKESLQKHQAGKLNSPIIQDIITILDDENLLDREYFSAFKASLCIVDLVKEIFYSSTIRAALFNDILVQWKSNEKDEEETEAKFIYNLPDGFNDEKIKAPLSYLLDRMIKELNTNSRSLDLERETTIQFLALNSTE